MSRRRAASRLGRPSQQNTFSLLHTLGFDDFSLFPAQNEGFGYRHKSVIRTGDATVNTTAADSLHAAAADAACIVIEHT